MVEITPNGIKTSDKEWGFDLVVCATGFDAIFGGLLDERPGKRGRQAEGPLTIWREDESWHV